MKRRTKTLIIVIAVLLAAAAVAAVLLLRPAKEEGERSSISVIDNNSTTEQYTQEGTDAQKLEAQTTAPTAPSYPVVELDVPEIERVSTDMLKEAEECDYTGLLTVENLLTGYSGEGYLVGFNCNPGDAVEAAFQIEAAQHYDITVSVYADSVVTNALVVNGE
jgi:hypothetical protein